MFFALFIFGFVYQLFLVYDALRSSSMIQIVGLCLYNLCLLLYAIFQPWEIKDALESLASNRTWDGKPLLTPGTDAWGDSKPALVALALVVAVATAMFYFVAWKLRSEFAWLVYKAINADLSMKKRVLILQVWLPSMLARFCSLLIHNDGPQPVLCGLAQVRYVLLARLFGPEHDLRFCQHGQTRIWIVYRRNSPRSLGDLACSCLCPEGEQGRHTCYHRKSLDPCQSQIDVLIFFPVSNSSFLQVAHFAAAGFLCYKLTNIPRALFMFRAFAAITLVMTLCTIGMAVLCLVNFGKGVKTFTESQQRQSSHNLQETDYASPSYLYGYTPRRSPLDD